MKPFTHNHWIIKTADIIILLAGLYIYLGDILLRVGVFSEVGKGFISVLVSMSFAVFIIFVAMLTVSCPNCHKLWILRTFFQNHGGFVYFIKSPKKCPLCNYNK